MIKSLPIDLKIKLIKKILNNMHPTWKEIEKLWAQEAEKRLQEIKYGKVKTIPADEVFGEIQKG